MTWNTAFALPGGIDIKTCSLKEKVGYELVPSQNMRLLDFRFEFGIGSEMKHVTQ